MKVELIDETMNILKSTYLIKINIVESFPIADNSTSASNKNTSSKINQNINSNGKAYLEANILSISETGYLTVEFSQNIKIPDNFTIINDTQMSLLLKPNKESDSSCLDFNWTVTSFNNRQMVIKLDF